MLNDLNTSAAYGYWAAAYEDPELYEARVMCGDDDWDGRGYDDDWPE